MKNYETMWSTDFIAALPSDGRPPEGYSKHYELRPVNAELFIYKTNDADVAVMVDGNNSIFVVSVDDL